jgi:hypothetical protein
MTFWRRGAHAYGVCVRVALAVAISSGAAACATSTKASPYNRDCGTARDGFVTPNDRWQSYGPLHVDMSAATAQSIARRVSPNEVQPPGSHPPAKDVPCVVASSGASAGAELWSNRKATDDWVSVAWTSYASGPSFGRFHCRATRRQSRAVNETCTHPADRHAGEITVRFIVRPVPTTS